MQLDTEYLRQHYASLSDDALLALDPHDLVEAARQVLDDEVRRRKLSSQPRSSWPPSPPDEELEPADEEVELADEAAGLNEPDGDDSVPDWLEEAVEVYSNYATDPNQPSSGALDARVVLDEAKVPCHLELFEEPKEERREYQYRWRVLVPCKLAHRAASVLDRDIFNAEFESVWRSHLQTLSNAELRVMEPQYAFCGLYDRIERINRAYDEELRSRKLKR